MRKLDGKWLIFLEELPGYVETSVRGTDLRNVNRADEVSSRKLKKLINHIRSRGFKANDRRQT